MTDATNYAQNSQQFDPNGQNSWESQFMLDEAQGAQANGANGILNGFKIPSTMTPGDLKQLVGVMEDYGTQVGYKHMPTPQEAMDAWKNGATDYQSAAKIWGQNLPAQLGWVKHGMRADDFSKYKENNQQAILTRYGAHADSKDENFVNNLDNPLNEFAGPQSRTPAGSTMGEAPVKPVDTLGSSSVR